MSEAQPRFVKPNFAEALTVVSEEENALVLDEILAEGSKSFAAASKLLPSDIRGAATSIYAFCRIADDAVDESSDGEQALGMLWERLDRIYEGLPDNHIVDRAFCDTVTRYRIPKAVPLALFEGFKWDLDGKQYVTIDDTLDYCARVASTVGVMMTLLMGKREPDVVARACDLGLAMQLTNICRDVGEDAANGRIYLPREWLVEAGVDPDSLLAHPRFTPALGTVVARVLDVAAEQYRSADIGISHLPRNSRLAIRAARLIYSDIGRVIAENDYDSIANRAYTGKLRKVWLCIRAFGAKFWFPASNEAAPHASVRFLVDSVAAEDGSDFYLER